jgi:hypothetical protein
MAGQGRTGHIPPGSGDRPRHDRAGWVQGAQHDARRGAEHQHRRGVVSDSTGAGPPQDGQPVPGPVERRGLRQRDQPRPPASQPNYASEQSRQASRRAAVGPRRQASRSTTPHTQRRTAQAREPPSPSGRSTSIMNGSSHTPVATCRGLSPLRKRPEERSGRSRSTLRGLWDRVGTPRMTRPGSRGVCAIYAGITLVAGPTFGSGPNGALCSPIPGRDR